MHNVIRNCIFPPDELVEQVVEPWDETKLSQHLVNLRGVTGGEKNNLTLFRQKIQAQL